MSDLGLSEVGYSVMSAWISNVPYPAPRPWSRFGTKILGFIYLLHQGEE
jgi:hypothetical protein